MAIAAVQALSFTSDASSANVSVNATAGNAIIVGGACYVGNQASSGFTATRTGDTYTTDIEGTSAGAVNRHRQGIASAPNVAGGAVSLSVTCVNAQAVDGWALELSGLPSASIRDATSPAIATGNSATATASSLTNATANAIFINVVGDESGTNPATMTPPGGYTITVGGTTMTRTNGSADQVCGLAYKIVAATGPETPAWTVTSDQWSSTIAVYEASSAVAMPPGLGPVVGEQLAASSAQVALMR